eukprot:TCONS_00016101-protein
MDAMMCQMDDLSKVNKQEKMLNNRKQKSRDAARNRRSKENDQYEALAKLLPLPESISSQLDKASIIRLTIGFLKYKDLIGTGGGMQHNGYRRNMMLMSHNGHNNNHHPYHPQRAVQKTSVYSDIEQRIGKHIEHALDGFMLTVSDNGHFIYVSDTIEQFLGLRQIDLIGTSAYDVIHPEDHQTFMELLCSTFQKSNQQYKMNNMMDFDAMTFMEMERKSKQGFVSLFIRFKCTLAKKGASVSKSAGYKVIHISGQMIPFKNLDHKGEQMFALVATGHALPPPTICELKLDTKVFVSRVSMDLKIVFCEGKIRKYMNFTAQDIVGMRAYDFYHLKDSHIVQDAHNDCLKSGKCRSLAYRWMNKTGGWVWMQTVGTVISRKTAKGEENQILCVNYISSDVEHEDEMMHSIQLKFKDMGITNKEDDMSDFGNDASTGPADITSDDVRKSYATPSTEEAADKESYLKSIDYHNMTNGHRAIVSDEPVKPNPAVFTHTPNLPPAPIPARPLVDEETKRRQANIMGDLQLADMLSETGPLPQIDNPFPDSPESYDMSHCDIISLQGAPQLPNENKNFGSREVFSMSNTMNFHHADNNNSFQIQQTSTSIYMEQQISPPLPRQTQQQANNSMSPQYQQPHDPIVMNEVNTFFNEMSTASNNSPYPQHQQQQQQPIQNNANSPQSNDFYNQDLSPKYETPSPEYPAQTNGGGNCSPPYMAPVGKESPPYLGQSMNSPPMFNNNQQTNAPPPYTSSQYNAPPQYNTQTAPSNRMHFNPQMESPLEFNNFNTIIKTEPPNYMGCGAQYRSNNMINRGNGMTQQQPLQTQCIPQQQQQRQNQMNNIPQCQGGHFDTNLPNGGGVLNQGQFNPDIPPIEVLDNLDDIEDIISSCIEQDEIQNQDFQQRLLIQQQQEQQLQQQAFVEQQMNFQNQQQNGQLPYNAPLRCNTTIPNKFGGYNNTNSIF